MPQPEYALPVQQNYPSAMQQKPAQQQPQQVPPHAQLAMKLSQQFGLPIQAALQFAMKLMTPSSMQPQGEPQQDAPYTYIPKTKHGRDSFMHAMTNTGATRTNSGGN